MKKYIRPEIKVRVLESENLLAGSGLELQSDGTYTQSKTNSFTTVEEESGVLSKHGSVWDGEEE